MKELYLLKAEDISKILAGQEKKVMDIVAQSYVDHTAGKSSLPHSAFLRFPGDDRNRIISLPAYLGGNTNTAGMKWISSFPGNIDRGLERASALFILNNMDTGHAEAVLEGSVISAKRTAASAALAAKLLHGDPGETVIGFVGCGKINKEISLFLKAVFKNLQKLVAFDTVPERAEQFLQEIKADGIEVDVLDSIEDIFQTAPLVSFATTAGSPYISDISACTPDSTILNISLRDFAPEMVLASDNIVDDADHVCREKTSLHLTEQLTGSRTFIRAAIADIITGSHPPRSPGKLSLYSPFGLGVLDLALACHVRRIAVENSMGSTIEHFFP